jgi:hypothetical protein
MMNAASREELLRAWAQDAAGRLVRAGEVLAARQTHSGPGQGNVPPWPGSGDLDFHGTLASIWLWARAQKLASDDRFAVNIAAAWSFVENAWRRFVPTALGAGASEEAPYDCAMVLRAAAADRSRSSSDLKEGIDAAARLLAVYLSDLDEHGGREFQDAGFLAWTLADYAREASERGLLASARRFVDRSFGMKAPPPFADEPTADGGLFDFSSTTATRILAVLAAEGATPFVGAWLRERVAPGIPRAFVRRTVDENAWNACVAAALGRAYVVSTDATFFDAHQAIVGELDARAEDGALGRQSGFSAETLPTLYYAFAVDSLVKV